MDKTTTWLVRGAAIVVISSGVIALFSFLKPKLIQFTLSKEEKEKIAIEKAEKRCENFPKITYPELLIKINKKEIKEWFTDFENYQIKNVRGKKLIITGIPSKSMIFSLLNSSGIPFKDEEKKLPENYKNLICK